MIAGKSFATMSFVAELVRVRFFTRTPKSHDFGYDKIRSLSGCALLLASLGLPGCAAPAAPAFTKMFQAPKKAPTNFSCGEDCPHSAKHSKRGAHSEHDGHQH
jgi:hypothetical protein